jgi:hypothetical protein
LSRKAQIPQPRRAGPARLQQHRPADDFVCKLFREIAEARRTGNTNWERNAWFALATHLHRTTTPGGGRG